jgi:glycosyltransferase involved in cell wall biosynthesis
MKLAFNIDYDYRSYTGIGRYGIELARAWIRSKAGCEIWMLRNTRGTPPDIPGSAGLLRYYPFPKRITDRIWPSLKAAFSGTKWIHSANGILLPGGAGYRQVTMVHDLGPFLFGHMKDDADTIPWRKRLRRMAGMADCVLVNSRATMEDLLGIFPGVEGKVFMTPLGIDHFAPGREQGAGDHMLNVGTVEPRKNIDGLLRAYSVLRQRRDVPPLVIAGMDGFRAEEYRELTRELSLGDRVRFTGYVTDAELTDLYRRAVCLVHPAHHEGFGFTVPEAFSWDLPVVASDTAGLAEYFTGAAWMVDPASIESIAHGMERALDSGVTEGQAARRRELREELTWDSCAAKTRQVLETLSGRSFSSS